MPRTHPPPRCPAGCHWKGSKMTLTIPIIWPSMAVQFRDPGGRQLAAYEQRKKQRCPD